MSRFSLDHLTARALDKGLETSFARENDAHADAIAHIAVIDAGQHYRELGYPSTHDYVVLRFRLTHDAANKRIRAARKAREYPAIFQLVADGALSLSVVNVLASHLTAENAAELLTAASGRTREEVEQLLAARTPEDAVATTIEAVPQPMILAADGTDGAIPLSPGPVQEVAKPRLVPIDTDLYKLQLTMTGTMYQKLRHARDLLGNRKPFRDEAEVLELALDVLVEKLEKKKFAATSKPRAPRRGKASSSRIPAHVQREVWERDGGQCTFRNSEGMRCPAKRDLEYEHIIPEARGGRSETDNLTLHCRAHNQLAAERVYGKAFMEAKREQARAAAAKRKAGKEAERESARTAAAERRSARGTEREQAKSAAAARKAEKEAKQAAERALDDDILMPGLRNLGFTRDQARFGLRECPPLEGEDLQARLKRILSVFVPPHRRLVSNGAAAS